MPVNTDRSPRVPAGYRVRAAAQAPARHAPLTGRGAATFSGPVRAAPPRLPVSVTLAQAASVRTPWGSHLAGEAGFQRWFDVGHRDWRPSETDLRYGLGPHLPGGARGEKLPGADLAADLGEAGRYGWVVELAVKPEGTPADPVKRTALGRFSPAGITAVESGGRVVVYIGDDEDGGYLYKFVGADGWRRLRADGRSPLDQGVLHVARLAADGSGQWVPLAHGQGPLTVRNGWLDQADVLLRTRLAADAVGATPLARPQQVAVDPSGESVYCAVAGGAVDVRCAAPDAGPVGPERESTAPGSGHVLRWREDAGDATAVGFRWDVVAETDGTTGTGQAAPFGRPRGLSFDADGRLWIRTALNGTDRDLPDEVYRALGNDAVLAVDPASGEVRRFLTVPRGREITALALAADQRTMSVTVAWPALVGTSRKDGTDPVTFVVRRADGGVIGAA
ncbi:alkaline phosphatase PhoX [Micromonospora sp. NPDC023888]|uniref:PhoX family protein n=1 Tax=Micromonospora sp. NPDC023888 TaxID=3155607 RepID=UPI0033F3E3F8